MSYTALRYFLIGFVPIAIIQLIDLGPLQTTAAAFTIVIFIKFSASSIISAIRESNKIDVGNQHKVTKIMNNQKRDPAMDEQDQKQEKNEEASSLIAYESPKQAKLAAQREIDILSAEFLKNGNKVTELPPSGIRKDYVGKVSYGNDYSGSINGAW